MASEPDNRQEDEAAKAIAEAPPIDGVNQSIPAAVPITPAFPGIPAFALPGMMMPPGMPAGVSVQQVSVWQGQFPPPDIVGHYEDIMPGTFNRLMAMAENQQNAVIDGNREARNNLRRDVKRGHYLGFAVTSGAMMGAVVCAYLQQPWVAAALVGVPVLSVAKALIDSSRALPAAVPTLTPVAPEAEQAKIEDAAGK